MIRVVFLGTQRSTEVPPGTSLLAATLRAGLPLLRTCGGAGMCRSCVIHVVDGEDLVAPPTAAERAAGATSQTRLACQALVAAAPPPPDVAAPQATRRSPLDRTETGTEAGTETGTAAGAPARVSDGDGTDSPLAAAPSAPPVLQIWSPTFGPLPDL